MKSLKSILTVSGMVFFIAMLLTTGCKKNNNNEPAPDLPPQSSFLMDFSAFSNPNDTAGASREIATFHNWGYSYANVVIWSTIVHVGLAVPVASFLESFNHEAVYHPDQNNWTWSYNVTVNMAVYEAELTGYLESDSVVWEMRITKGSEYSNFLWYYGKSAIGGTGGYWILQENPLNENPLLRIDWHHTSSDIADISYTNIRPGDGENGGYIFYGMSNETLNRFYHIFNKGLDNLTEIEWSAVTREGRVKDPNHYSDSDWHCWDTNLMDTVCM